MDACNCPHTCTMHGTIVTAYVVDHPLNQVLQLFEEVNYMPDAAIYNEWYMHTCSGMSATCCMDACGLRPFYRYMIKRGEPQNWPMPSYEALSATAKVAFLEFLKL